MLQQRINIGKGLKPVTTSQERDDLSFYIYHLCLYTTLDPLVLCCANN